MVNFDISALPTPCYIVDEDLLCHNLEILKGVSERTGCKILLAQKCFSMYAAYPLIAKYLQGSTASSLHEVRLGYEEMGKPFDKETHIFSPAYREDEFEEIISCSDHIVFNSPAQVRRFGEKAKAAGSSIGLRVNPERRTQEHDIYDPCAPFSRLGTPLSAFDEEILPMLDGLHFHTLCEQNSDDLELTVEAFEEKFGKYMGGMKWLNLGGGHHITRADYDIEKLVKILNHLRERYDVQLYLEPGEAVALNAGFLVSEVMETGFNGMNLAILDTSAACHMPDVLEMPYRPNIIGAGQPNEKPHTYRFGGPTCLAGDIIGDYSFDEPLKVGDRLVFCDMAIYSMVKNNTFNGLRLPDILLRHSDGSIETVKSFGYEDFKRRL